MTIKSLFTIVAVAVLSVVSAARADVAPPFPSTWAQGGPYSTEALKGKIVVLVYYEEGCPSCRKMWPGLVTEAKKFADKPVLFVAVNSGNHPAKVQSYMRGVQCDWPAIADVDRSFESASNVGVISLQNIHQTRVIRPDGQLSYDGELTESVERNLAKATWKIDPATVPERFKEVWRYYEFGSPKIAALGLKRVRASTDEEKAFVKMLGDRLAADAEERFTKAKAAQDAGDTWQAYKLYDSVSTDFPDTQQATNARAQSRQLDSDAKVKNEKAAAKMLAQVQALASSPRPDEQATAKVGAAKLIEKYPDTEAAKAAERYK